MPRARRNDDDHTRNQEGSHLGGELSSSRFPVCLPSLFFACSALSAVIHEKQTPPQLRRGLFLVWTSVELSLHQPHRTSTLV